MIHSRGLRLGLSPLLIGLGLTLAAISPASAATIDLTGISFACPGGSKECKGQTFALWLHDSGPDYFDVAFSIDTTGFKGPESYAFGVEVKDLYDSTGKSIYGSLSLQHAPGGVDMWYVDTTQLSQSCVGKDKMDTACASWKTTSPGMGYDFSVGEVMTWVFRIGGTSVQPDTVGHIKYWYKDASGSKTGGLLSQDVPVQTPPPTQVPDEGSTMTLALFGLGAVGAAFRKWG